MTATVLRTTTSMADEQEAMTSVGKALALLDAFPQHAPSVGLTELARRAGVSKSTAYRLLGTLVEFGYVERRGSRYCTGRKLFELGHSVSDCRPRGLRDIALPYLSEMYERTHQVIHLAVLAGTDVLYLEKLYGHGSVRTPSRVGCRLPAACSGLGKVLLAHSEPEIVQEVVNEGLRPLTCYTIQSAQLFLDELDRIREVGVAYDREEMAVGLACVAAPITTSRGAVAAISVSSIPSRLDLDATATMVKRAASAIAGQMR